MTLEELGYIRAKEEDKKIFVKNNKRIDIYSDGKVEIRQCTCKDGIGISKEELRGIFKELRAQMPNLTIPGQIYFELEEMSKKFEIDFDSLIAIALLEFLGRI